MASTYSPILKIELIGNGDQSGTWGTTTNNNLGTIIEQAIAGTATINVTSADVTLTNLNGVSDEARCAALYVTGTPGTTRNIIAPAYSKLYVIANTTASNVVIKTVSSTGTTVIAGTTVLVYFNGTDFVLVGQASASTNTANTLVLRDSSGNFAAGTITATLSGNATNISGTLAVAQGGTGATTTTGSGANVLATSPTLVTPALGTPTSGNFSTGTFTWPTFNQNTTGTAAGLSATLAVLSGGTGVTTSTGSGSNVLSTSPTLVTPILGTPTSGNFSTGTFTWPTFNQNTTGTAAGLSATLAVASGGTGVTTSTGSGSNVLSTSPSLTTPALAGETFSTAAAVTAGTNAQGQGALTNDYNVITTAAANPSGVTLPTATTGRRVVIVNKGVNPINVYPATGASIDALSVNISIQIPANNTMEFNASSTTQWYSSYNLYTSANVSSGVTSFSAGTTGLTPSGATTGAVSLAGTLGTANGGTNLTTFTAANNAIYSTSASVLAAGTLPVLAGGTGVTTSTGTGNNVLSTSPTLVTPILGSPTSGNFSVGTFTWPTFNQNTTGTAAGLSSTLSVASGGTGLAGTLTGVAYGNGASSFSAATAAQIVAAISTTAVTNATNATNATNITNSGGWSVTPSGTTLYFNYNGVNVAKLDSSGNLTTKANVIANGTV